MKLFKKIFLQVFVGCVLLTMIPLLYFLYESQQQSLRSVYLYEGKNFRQNQKQFQSELEKAFRTVEDQKILDVIAVQIFRDLIGSNGALYREGQELYNMSPFEFDLEGFREKKPEAWFAGEEAYPSKSNFQEASGKKLLVFGDEWIYPGIPAYYVIYCKDVTDIYQRTENLFLKGLCFAAALLAVIGVTLYVGIYRSIRPLMELRQTAVSIAEGSYGSRTPVRGKDEIGELAVSFNQMAGKVEEHVEELSHVNQTQRQLIGSLAHELKTPLTAIIGYSDTLLTVPLSEKRRVQALRYIQSEGQRLSRLSAKMLELTGLYEEGISVSMKEIKAAEFFRRLKDLTAYRLKEKNIRLDVSWNPGDLIFRADEDLLMSLMMNLIDNAYKASEPNGRITVFADRQGISVTDRGKGIPAEEIRRVTEAFYMVDKSRSRSAGSTGLGLAFCQQIAKLHGAELILESEEGKGTRVSVMWEVTKRLHSDGDLM